MTSVLPLNTSISMFVSTSVIGVSVAMLFLL
jgi:hypothetical protein